MQVSFRSFGFGLLLSTLLVYLILVAQFESFLDPFLILLAVPTGLTGVLLILFATGTTLNIMSLMGVVMMVGIVVSNSILIVEFTRRLRRGRAVVAGGGGAGLPGAPAAGADDLAGDAHRPAADGGQAGHRQRSLRAAGPRHHRRPGGVGGADGVHRAGGVLCRLSPAGGSRPPPLRLGGDAAPSTGSDALKAAYDQSTSQHCLRGLRSALALISLASGAGAAAADLAGGP